MNIQKKEYGKSDNGERKTERKRWKESEQSNNGETYIGRKRPPMVNETITTIC